MRIRLLEKEELRRLKKELVTSEPLEDYWY
jgi:hypothetical protein